MTGRAPFVDDGDLVLYHGDAITVLQSLPSGIAQTCMTSPPYWGLRSYLEDGHVDKHVELGLEATPTLYVERIVAVFREVRRVLRDDGTLWLNLGDSYATGTGTPSKPSADTDNGYWQNADKLGRSRIDGREAGLKPKDLVGIPWRVAFALQADGWYLRSDIIWSKNNPMPESVTDRPTKSHEYLFLFSKQPRYYMDMDSIREPHQGLPSGNVNSKPNPAAVLGQGDTRHSIPWQPDAAGRNRRSVWTIPTEPFPEAHFATYPQALVAPCIQAGTSERGECGECGAPWRRVVERSGQPPEPDHRNPAKRLEPGQAGNVGNGNMGFRASRLSGQEMAAWKAANPDVTTGWEPSCTCDASSTPQTVLDPFVGSGTTCLVARKHGRRCIGIDLSAEYLALAAKRTQQLSLLGGVA